MGLIARDSKNLLGKPKNWQKRVPDNADDYTLGLKVFAEGKADKGQKLIRQVLADQEKSPYLDASRYSNMVATLRNLDSESQVKSRDPN